MFSVCDIMPAMQAVVYLKFGPPEVLQLAEVPTPTPADNEVLVRIHATAVVADDPMMRRAPGFNGIVRPKHRILGGDFAGEVAAVGRGVTTFQPGDRVYGYPNLAMGCYAQYTCLAEDGPLELMPANVSYQEAAAVPNGSLTALGFLAGIGGVQAGQRVLVYGASGSVGTAAVQLAKHFGADVSGVCSTGNVELVASLGADRVIDYTREDFADSGGYDIIFDTVGKCPVGRAKGALNPGGLFMTTVPNFDVMLQALLTSGGRGKRVRFGAMGLRSQARKRAGLEELRRIIEAGGLRAVIDRTYPLAEIVEAHRYVETGRKKGNVVITVNHR